MKSPEANFEKELKYVARSMGCMYIKIPDTRMINASNRYMHREEKRPFDSILVTPYGNVCVECKINSAKLSQHQRWYRDKIEKINRLHFVFRKRILKKSVYYQLETCPIPKFNKIKDMLGWLMVWLKP